MRSSLAEASFLPSAEKATELTTLLYMFEKFQLLQVHGFCVGNPTEAWYKERYRYTAQQQVQVVYMVQGTATSSRYRCTV